MFLKQFKICSYNYLVINASRNTNYGFFLSVIVASPSLVDEISGVSAECTEISKTPVPVTASSSSSLKQQEINTCSPGDQGLPGASNAAFESTTSMHVNEQENSVDLPNMQIHGGAMLFKSFSEMNACLGSLGTYTNKDPFPSCQAGVYVQGNYFSPHWPVEAVEKAAEVRTIVGFRLVQLKILICGHLY